MNLIEMDFAHLGRTEKSNFISEHIEFATPKAVGEYVRGYLFDVLKSVNDDGYIINYITERGYKVEKKQPNEQLPYVDWNNTGFLNELSVVLVRCYAPKNKFQKELVRLLSPLHGMCVQTERLNNIGGDIMCITKALDKKYPRRSTSAFINISKDRSDMYGQKCDSVLISDSNEYSGDDYGVVSIYFMPLKGLLHFVNDYGVEQMCAVPFEPDGIAWAMEYNQLVQEQGGKL